MPLTDQKRRIMPLTAEVSTCLQALLNKSTASLVAKIKNGVVEDLSVAKMVGDWTSPLILPLLYGQGCAVAVAEIGTTFKMPVAILSSETISR